MTSEIPMVPEYLLNKIHVVNDEPIGMCYSLNRPLSSYEASYIDLLLYFIAIKPDSLQLSCLSRESDGKDYLHIYLHNVSVIDADEPPVVKGQILVTVYSHSYLIIGKPTALGNFVRTELPSKKMGDLAVPWALQNGRYT